MDSSLYPLFSFFSFLGFVVALIPLPWHFQAWNAGTCIYMIWASFSSLIQFVNSVIWHGNVVDAAPVWCDISTKFIIGAGVGIPASSLCINRRLYKIASMRSVTITRQERRRAIYIDIAISVGLPILVMALHYIVQGHRYNILEDIGCLPEIYNTPPAYPLVFMWPVLLGCISFVYAFLTLRAFWIRRIQFQQLLSSATSMSVNRYFRLMMLSCTEMTLTIPFASYSIYVNTAGLVLSPWISWADTHFDFSHVEQIPAAIWRSQRSYLISVEMGRWLYPCCAFIFFALFGFADEARRNYKSAFLWVATRLRIRCKIRKNIMGGSFGTPLPPRFDGATSIESLPPYVPPQSSYDLSMVDIEKNASSKSLSPTLSTDKAICSLSPPSSPLCREVNLAIPPSPSQSHWSSSTVEQSQAQAHAL